MLTVEQKELHWSINKIQLIISADIFMAFAFIISFFEIYILIVLCCFIPSLQK